MKKARHKKILSLISEFNIDRQEVLLDYLKKEGFKVTQATVSRDIKELNLVKIVSSNGEYKYAQNTIVEDTKATFTRFDFIFSDKNYCKRPVLQYSLNGELLKEWESAAEAGKNGFSRTSITMCCKNKIKTANGYVWRYAEN